MSKILIAHCGRDEAAALGVCAVVRSAVSFELKPEQSAAKREPMVLLWAKNAPAQSALFVEAALTHGGPVCICLFDDTPLAADVLGLGAVVFSSDECGAAFEGSVRRSLIEARRVGPLRRASRIGERVSQEGAFAIGVARGLVSSVAVLGLGGVAAIGAAEGVQAGGAGADNPLSTLLGASSAAAQTVTQQEAGLPSEDGLRNIVVSMQERYVRDRSMVEGRLEDVRQDLEADSEAMTKKIEALQQLSRPESWRVVNAAPTTAHSVAQTPREVRRPSNNHVALRGVSGDEPV
ncbi:MAG: hypothetical protein ABW199_05745 [Caulobacterales bacterium]